MGSKLWPKLIFGFRKLEPKFDFVFFRSTRHTQSRKVVGEMVVQVFDIRSSKEILFSLFKTNASQAVPFSATK